MTGKREKQAASGFAARLREVIEAYGSASGLAKAIERSEGAVRKWLRGESEPNLTDLRTLCEQTHTSIEWLVTGRRRRERVHTLDTPPPSYDNQPNTPPLNYALMEAIRDAIDVEVSKDMLDLTSPNRSMLVVTLYDMFQESQKVDSDAVSRLVKLARKRTSNLRLSDYPPAADR